MPWTKIDDQYFFNPKVLAAGRDARDVHLASMVYSSGQLTDGFIPTNAVPLVGAMAMVANVQECAAKLVDVGLWECVEGGYLVHDYLKYNPPSEQVRATREARAEAGRRGGLASAESRREADAETSDEANGQANAQANAEQNPTPSPSPSPSHTPENGDASAPPPARSRQPSEKDLARKALEEHFVAVTGLPSPKQDTEADRRAAGSQWWKPLRIILDLARGDVATGKRLIDQSVRKLRDGELTIADPNSILKTARAISATSRASPRTAPPIVGWSSPLTGESSNGTG